MLIIFSSWNNNRKYKYSIINTSLENNISTNSIATKMQQDTKYIDIYRKEVTTKKTNLSNIITKEITQIEFFQNEKRENQVVQMPRTIERIPNQLPSAITSLKTCLLLQKYLFKIYQTEIHLIHNKYAKHVLWCRSI